MEPTTTVTASEDVDTMTDEEFKKDQQTIIQTLEGAGWSKTERGESMGAASLVYDNGAAELGVDQYYGELELAITVASPDGREVNLFAEYGDDLEPLLQALIASQRDITPENFRDHVRRWLQACPDIYYQEDEDAEPQKLTPE
jgi:hypothetical protein